MHKQIHLSISRGKDNFSAVLFGAPYASTEGIYRNLVSFMETVLSAQF